ncbi:hypothetical protein EYR41_002205 [Orbilia oligospora]|uniref:Nucleoside phosphorylase domain-containing protein n=1 Tax=Orbilia oligospora TaxID=2813651 RepID=A0A8H2EDT2_ORBOL|nr:hypothetical protein EYR41_002205 [Orbilia oligospora]
MAPLIRQAQRGSSTRSGATTPRPRPSRPATPSCSLPADEDLVLDKNALVTFATRAVVVLREECNSLKRQFQYDGFLTSLSLTLSHVKERLDAADSPTGSRILRLLIDLERLAKWPSFKKPKVPDSQIYHHRFILALNENPQHARDSIKRLAKSTSNDASEDRKKFLKTFKAFANTKSEPLEPEFSDLTASNPRPASNDETTECLQCLYSMLCQTCRCSVSISNSDFKVNIAPDIVTAPAGSDGVLIELFFRHQHISSHEENEWKEAQIRVFLERSDVGNSTKKSKSLVFARKGDEIRDFCDLVRSRALGRLNLSVSSRGFFNDGLELAPSKRELSLRTPSISLADVLVSTSLRSDNQRKLLLSYLLSKAVWQFYDSDWMAEAWTKHNVHFMRQCLDRMQQKVRLYHKPFISADLGVSAAPSNDLSPKRSHIFPEILALGVMLLEIELGQNIEDHYSDDFLDADGKPRENADHITAGIIINSEKWGSRSATYQAVKKVIEICVKPDKCKLGVDPTRVRDNLYQSVVVPLKNLFALSWACPDGSPENFDPGPMDLTLFDGLADNDTFEPDVPNSGQATTAGPLPSGLNYFSRYYTPGRNHLSSGGQCRHKDVTQKAPGSPSIDGNGGYNYAIGWICAIPIELAAATAFLDELHETPPMSPSENDIYKFGRIGNHNIVVACLPAGSYGNISAAAVGTRMKARFPALRFGLMVGIGGGIPRDELGVADSSTDLHLGDVVVGTPTGSSGGTFQYDFGKTIEGGAFIHTGSLRKPPDILLSAVSSIQAKHPRVLRKILSEHVSKAQKVDDRLSHPGQGNDHLFDANYEHKKGNVSCKLCDTGKLVSRRPREDNNSYVHYGIIASGGQVVRHGPTRDKIGRECRALCFEMEAAGLMNIIPCLVVRGISDYSDSHKNDSWQGYAAASAAAFAKELLLEIPPISV